MWKRWLCVVFCLWLLVATVSAEELPSLSSRSAVVYLPETGEWLYEKDADTPRPMASTTKLMTALLAAETLLPDTLLTISNQAIQVEGSSLGLRGGDRITVFDLLTGMLLVSGNDAANAAALAVDDTLPAFAARMNARAKTLGMKNTCFVTPSGLDAEGHAASARDMALLGAAVLDNSMLAQICATKTTQIAFGNPPTLRTVTNHNRLLTKLSDCVGLKTGYTTKAGRCLVSAVTRNSITLVTVTLNGHDYWEDHIALYDYGFSCVKRVDLPVVDMLSIAVSGGLQAQVALRFTTPSAPIVSAEEQTVFSVKVELPTFVTAPVVAGETLGRVCYYKGNSLWKSVPVTAAHAVGARPKDSIWLWWWRSLYQLLTAL